MVVINIYSGSRDEIEATLSNFAHTPFVLGWETIASVEGFHQGIKYEDLIHRREIFQLWGLEAKRAGKQANRLASGYVYWGEGRHFRMIRWQSPEYLELYHQALLAKFTQHQGAREALLATGEARFSHRLPTGGGLDEAAFQATPLGQSLYRIRSLLQIWRRRQAPLEDLTDPEALEALTAQALAAESSESRP